MMLQQTLRHHREAKRNPAADSRPEQGGRRPVQLFPSLETKRSMYLFGADFFAL
jgi:hypothetical protein